VAHERGQIPCDGEQLIEIDPGVMPHGLKHVDEVFGTHVTGRTGRERAATESAHGAIESPDTYPQ
jgi:hypothetical protein